MVKEGIKLYVSGGSEELFDIDFKLKIDYCGLIDRKETQCN